MIRLISLLIVLSLQSFGAEVTGARLDGANQNILVDVVHGGGCGTHEYKLELGACMETFPVRCTAELIHISDDPCEAILSRTAVFNLKQYGLDNKYYERASFTIYGSKNSSGKKSSASIQLP